VERIKQIIIEWEKTVHTKHRQVLKDAVILGLWLDKLSKIYYGKFNSFVKDNIKFGPRWVRGLRSVTRVFCKYKKLQNLCIDLSAAVRIVSRVERAIDSLDTQERQFWVM
jgi:tRNA isopentenyl-2-thiomethyl-A-37 hydroxylase MiaE